MERLKKQEKGFLLKTAQVLSYAFVLVLFSSCGNSSDDKVSSNDIYFDYGYNEERNENIPIVEFESSEYNFGILTEGESVAHTFKFKNTGKSNLIISSVDPSCGCTVPRKFTRDPIPPGKSGSIEVEFNSTDNTGDVKKAISVLSNSIPNKAILYLKGEVIPLERLNQLNDDK